MTANLYCSRADVTDRLPIGTVASSSDVAAESSIGDDTITLDGHGLNTGDPVYLRALSGGALPAPLVDGARYFAIRVTNSTFQVSSTPYGAAIDLTSAAVSMVVAREPKFDDAIEFYSRWADDFFPAHLVPFCEPIHPLVKGLVADLAAKRIQNVNGKDSAVVAAAEVAAMAQLQRHAAGLTLRGAFVNASANCAVANPLGNHGDPRGWGSSRLP